MDAYIYKAALYCKACADEIYSSLPGIALTSDDSEDCPQGPYSNGGGEADSPQYCDNCQVFLENPLTPEGMQYVKEQAEASPNPVTEVWAEFYGVEKS